MSTSFLTQGRYAKPALMIAALGFDPVAVVRRAVLSGRLPDPAKCGRLPDPAKCGQRARQPVRVRVSAAEQAKRKAAYHLAYTRRARAANVARGLTQDGTPRKYQWRNIGPFKSKDYSARYKRLVRKSKATGPVRPYRKRA